jgi:ubiquinone biosynthesis protein
MPFKTLRSAVEIYRELPRYRDIIFILLKYGFRDIVKLAHLQHVLAMDRRTSADGTSLRDQPWQVRLRMMLEELGPTFIKIGQILSTRRDIVPESLLDELSRLQRNASPFSFTEAKKILEQELGRPIEEVFGKIDETPIAAASISQVHRATLVNGDRVAVKVQRPGIEKVVSVDLAILLDLAGLVQDIEELQAVNPRSLVQEFSRTLMQELDFTQEVRNTVRFARQFARDGTICVPRVYEDYCSRRVIVMEFISGHPIDDPAELRTRGVDPLRLSENLCKLMFKQMFEIGFFHADPHPGNFTILPGGVAGIYDCGMMGNLRQSMRENLAALVYGLVEKRHHVVANAVLDLSEEGFVADHHRLVGDIEEFSREHLDRPLGEIQLAHVLNRMIDLLTRHKIRLRSDLYLGMKAISQLEAIGKALNPDIHVVEFGEPYAMRAIAGRFDPTRLAREIPEAVMSSFEVIKALPDDLRDLYYRIKRGKFTIPMQHTLNSKGFEPMRQTLDRAAHLFSAGVVTAAMLVSSSILILARLPPVYGETSLSGVFFFLVGFVMFLRMIFRSWRDGGL